jgi:hypothetical protein
MRYVILEDGCSQVVHIVVIGMVAHIMDVLEGIVVAILGLGNRNLGSNILKSVP